VRITLVLLAVCIAASAACGGLETSPSTAGQPAPSASPFTLAIEGNTSFAMKGETSQLKAIATMVDGHREDRTSTVAWSSADPAVATVNAAGMVTAVGDGHTVVTATTGTFAATRPVTVDLPVK